MGHQKVRDFVTKHPKMAKAGQNLAFLILKGAQARKSTPPPVLAVVTDMMSYASTK